MENELKYGLKISLLSDEDGGGYFVEVPDLPGCMTDGDTLLEAVEKAKQAIETWIEAAKETNRPIPKPNYYRDYDSFSGKFSLRLPKDLHKELVEAAEEQGVSLNQLVIYYLSKSIGKELGKEEIGATIDREMTTTIRYYKSPKDQWDEDLNPAELFNKININSLDMVHFLTRKGGV